MVFFWMGSSSVCVPPVQSDGPDPLCGVLPAREDHLDDGHSGVALLACVVVVVVVAAGLLDVVVESAEEAADT